MTVGKIYFDMDGVLADFDKGVMDLCGLARPDANNPREDYEKEMWSRIRNVPHFYDVLLPLEEGMRLFTELYEIYGDKCEILTGIPKPNKGVVTAGEDKISWCRRLLPDGIKVNVVYKEQKKDFCKGKEDILIDDMTSNIKDWSSAGGTGIFYVGYDDAVSVLKSMEII